MLESADERKLNNHQKYLRIWDKHEEQVQNHFTRQADIKAGKTLDFAKK